MFKKVFISLLILSALSAEGVISSPADIYSIYFNYANLLEQCDDNSMSLDANAKDNADFVLLAEAGMHDGVLSQNINTEKAKLRNYLPDFNLYGFDSIPDIVIFNSSFTKNQAARRIVVQKSDSSPPHFLI